MCVVTFYPISDSEYILTSNRDEAPDRPTLPAEIYTSGDTTLLYPKDQLAGGTWIGASSYKRLVALMNGGFVPHIRKKSYRLSRGLVVLNLLTAENSTDFFDSFDFNGIEPFTIILFEFRNEPILLQIVWDGDNLHKINLPLQPKLWSSSPLYTPEMNAVRVSWFNKFISEHNPIKPEDLLKFHYEGTGDKKVPILLDFETIHTKSITQLIALPDQIKGIYHDLETDKECRPVLAF